MAQSYVGIVSHLGLEELWPEHPHTLRFLSRAAARWPRGGYLVWAVLDEVIFHQIRREIQIGNHLEGIVLLPSAMPRHGNV